MCVWSQPQITQIASRDSAGVGVVEGVGQRQTWQMCVNLTEGLFPRCQPGKPFVCVCSVAAAVQPGTLDSPRLPLDEGS